MCVCVRVCVCVHSVNVYVPAYSVPGILYLPSMKRQRDRTLKDELPRSVGAQYATGDQWRNNTRKNEVMDPKKNQHPVVGVTGNGSKIQ